LLLVQVLGKPETVPLELFSILVELAWSDPKTN